jgi:hypothetical protein
VHLPPSALRKAGTRLHRGSKDPSTLSFQDDSKSSSIYSSTRAERKVCSPSDLAEEPPQDRFEAYSICNFPPFTACNLLAAGSCKPCAVTELLMTTSHRKKTTSSVETVWYVDLAYHHFGPAFVKRTFHCIDETCYMDGHVYFLDSNIHTITRSTICSHTISIMHHLRRHPCVCHIGHSSPRRSWVGTFSMLTSRTVQEEGGGH